MKKQTIDPKSFFDSRPYGFSQIVIANPCKLVFTSGQTAWDANLNITGENNLAKQTRKSLDYVKTAMEVAGEL